MLGLKESYKKLTGTEWTPGAKPAASAPVNSPSVASAPSVSGNADEILSKIAEQGDKIRKLKQEKADKKAVEPEVISF